MAWESAVDYETCIADVICSSVRMLPFATLSRYISQRNGTNGTVLGNCPSMMPQSSMMFDESCERAIASLESEMKHQHLVLMLLSTRYCAIQIPTILGVFATSQS